MISAGCSLIGISNSYVSPKNTPGVIFALLFLAVTASAQLKSPALSSGDIFAKESSAAARSILALKRLEKLVVHYRSIGEFESEGTLARVTFEVFDAELQSVMMQVEPMLRELPGSKLKVQLLNALYTYRDGAFWWSRLTRSRVINAAAYSSVEKTITAADAALASTIPYTVALHWRQASKYLESAEHLISR